MSLLTNEIQPNIDIDSTLRLYPIKDIGCIEWQSTIEYILQLLA